MTFVTQCGEQIQYRDNNDFACNVLRDDNTRCRGQLEIDLRESRIVDHTKLKCPVLSCRASHKITLVSSEATLFINLSNKNVLKVVFPRHNTPIPEAESLPETTLELQSNLP